MKKNDTYTTLANVLGIDELQAEAAWTGTPIDTIIIRELKKERQAIHVDKARLNLFWDLAQSDKVAAQCSRLTDRHILEELKKDDLSEATVRHLQAQTHGDFASEKCMQYLDRDILADIKEGLDLGAAMVLVINAHAESTRKKLERFINEHLIEHAPESAEELHEIYKHSVSDSTKKLCQNLIQIKGYQEVRQGATYERVKVISEFLTPNRAARFIREHLPTAIRNEFALTHSLERVEELHHLLCRNSYLSLSVKKGLIEKCSNAAHRVISMQLNTGASLEEKRRLFHICVQFNLTHLQKKIAMEFIK